MQSLEVLSTFFEFLSHDFLHIGKQLALIVLEVVLDCIFQCIIHMIEIQVALQHDLGPHLVDTTLVNQNPQSF